MTAQLRLYRKLLRTVAVSFRNDELMLEAARREIKGKFEVRSPAHEHGAPLGGSRCMPGACRRRPRTIRASRIGWQRARRPQSSSGPASCRPARPGMDSVGPFVGFGGSFRPDLEPWLNPLPADREGTHKTFMCRRRRGGRALRGAPGQPPQHDGEPMRRGDACSGAAMPAVRGLARGGRGPRRGHQHGCAEAACS
jgi:hypothetical protein